MCVLQLILGRGWGNTTFVLRPQLSDFPWNTEVSIWSLAEKKALLCWSGKALGSSLRTWCLQGECSNVGDWTYLCCKQSAANRKWWNALGELSWELEVRHTSRVGRRQVRKLICKVRQSELAFDRKTWVCHLRRTFPLRETFSKVEFSLISFFSFPEWSL